MDELANYLPPIGTGIGLAFAFVYAVKRMLHQDDEWERIVKQKDADNAILRAEIDKLKTELEKDGKR